jgi:hypothetical protein
MLLKFAIGVVPMVQKYICITIKSDNTKPVIICSKSIKCIPPMPNIFEGNKSGKNNMMPVSITMGMRKYMTTT